MRTAISVPDETFERASRHARTLGISRSEFFSRAAAHYLGELGAAAVTRQIDLTLAELATGERAAADAVIVGRQAIINASGDW